ncbi:MAG: NAD-dependent epimerase/dehydratase family protein [Spirochaetales bacterium]|nr:NAD-dependent epimerase/dehydratase family protein [Spirochaetales bacterium]
MEVAIIGGSGFIGTRLAARLISGGHQVRIIDKLESRAYPDLWRPGDVRNPESLIAALKGAGAVFNLAAEHRDDVSPVSLYYDVNVKGAGNVCEACRTLGIENICFTSSVAVYGHSDVETDENGEFHPENEYGKSKLAAEKIYRTWMEESDGRTLSIIRPTVCFGEDNRGNVYNLLRQMASGKFMMIGKGINRKSMCYVENLAAFLQYNLEFGNGLHIYNYIDKPDFDMNSLVRTVRRELGKNDSIKLRIPYGVGMAGGYCFDLLARILKRKLPISSVRVAKFNQNTLYKSSLIDQLGFNAPVPLQEGLERTIRHEFNHIAKKNN